MKIFGVDFTSAPSSGKCITYTACEFDDGKLLLATSSELRSFEAFEEILARLGLWVAGLDFAFGQPRRLIENIGWPSTWKGYVQLIGGMSKPDFVETLRQYRLPRPSGDKQHLRRTDELAKSRSPMMLYGVPVGKMFFEGAPRLLKSVASILPCRPNDDNRILVEAYPALVVRRWIGAARYKNDDIHKQTEALRAGREKIVSSLRSGTREQFGFDIQLSDEWARDCTADGTADQLDAMLCAVQAAWAYFRGEQGYGIPADCDALEGWIVDPLMSN